MRRQDAQLRRTIPAAGTFRAAARGYPIPRRPVMPEADAPAVPADAPTVPADGRNLCDSTPGPPEYRDNSPP